MLSIPRISRPQTAVFPQSCEHRAIWEVGRWLLAGRAVSHFSLGAENWAENAVGCLEEVLEGLWLICMWICKLI